MVLKKFEGQSLQNQYEFDKTKGLIDLKIMINIFV